jgi:hypothetical protein
MGFVLAVIIGDPACFSFLTAHLRFGCVEYCKPFFYIANGRAVPDEKSSIHRG